MDPPPKMYEIGTLEGALEIVLSGFSTSSNFFFGVEFGVAFNVLTTGLFRIQQSSHASASTLCHRESTIVLYCRYGIYLRKISSFPLVELSRPGRGFVR